MFLVENTRRNNLFAWFTIPLTHQAEFLGVSFGGVANW